MQGRVEVSSFEAVEHFRSALIRFVETANAAMASAEVEIIRTISWLETDQLPHWKAMLRTTADEVEKAKTAYRQKALFKDATGARHSGIDELKALRKAEARRAEVEQRAMATRRNLRQLQREHTLYQGSIQHLRSMVNGRLPVAIEELRRVVEQLERYAAASPDRQRRAEPAADVSREPMPGLAEPPGLTHEESPAVFEDALRRRTPEAHVRRSARRSGFVPLLPEVPDLAMEVLVPHCTPQAPGRYDLITTTVCPDDVSGDLYLERCARASPDDTGWHIGPAGPETTGGACVTITAGRVESQRPALGRLLSLPVGYFLKIAGGRLVLAIDALGRPLWREDASMSTRGDG